MFSDGMKNRRIQLGLSQLELSRKCGVPQSTISAVESGTRIPKEDTMVMIAKGLNCSVGALLGENDRCKEKKPIAEDDGLRALAIDRVSYLSEPALERVLDFLTGLEAGQEIGVIPAAAHDSNAGST